jgi:transmembrane protein 33
MKAVAYIELVIFVRVVLGAITLQNSLLSPLIYAHFLRQRYYQSAFTRDAIAYTTARIDKFIRKPGNPPALIGIWEKVQMVVGRWSGSTLEPAAGANGAAGPRRG